MVLKSDAIIRIAKDVKSVYNNIESLKNNNIYYKHSEDNVTKGYAMIVGPEDTPYAFGYYFFEFNFPDEYPYSPPIVKYLTNDGTMRFNPNLYLDGKVCLSLLNTWSGEGWSSCQTITSILLVLVSIFNNNPLINEPGININNINVKTYNLLVSFKNVEYTIIKQSKMIYDNNNFDMYHQVIELFNSEFKILLKNNYDKIYKNVQLIEKLLSGYNNNINITIYNLSYSNLNVNKLIFDLDNINKIL